ncbi:unnamed protein product [Mucor circinelloides]
MTYSVPSSLLPQQQSITCTIVRAIIAVNTAHPVTNKEGANTVYHVLAHLNTLINTVTLRIPFDLMQQATIDFCAACGSDINTLTIDQRRDLKDQHLQVSVIGELQPVLTYEPFKVLAPSNEIEVTQLEFHTESLPFEGLGDIPRNLTGRFHDFFSDDEDLEETFEYDIPYIDSDGLENVSTEAPLTHYADNVNVCTLDDMNDIEVIEASQHVAASLKTSNLQDADIHAPTHDDIVNLNTDDDSLNSETIAYLDALLGTSSFEDVACRCTKPSTTDDFQFSIPTTIDRQEPSSEASTSNASTRLAKQKRTFRDNTRSKKNRTSVSTISTTGVSGFKIAAAAAPLAPPRRSARLSASNATSIAAIPPPAATNTATTPPRRPMPDTSASTLQPQEPATASSSKRKISMLHGLLESTRSRNNPR